MQTIRRFFRTLDELGVQAVTFMAALAFGFFALALSAVPTLAQGSGVGTLPIHVRTMSFAKPVTWLSAYSTITEQADTGAVRVYFSSHNGEDLANVPPSDAGVKEVTWRHNHSTFRLVCPEWLSEVEDTTNGAQHWEARFAAEVTEGQLHFPPDAT